MADKPLTLKQAAEYLGVAKITLYRWVAEGSTSTIPRYKVEGQWRFFKNELEQWIRKHKKGENNEKETALPGR